MIEDAPVWEVFICPDPLAAATEVGTIRAMTADLALQLAREAYGRRGTLWDLWVVPESAVSRARERGWAPETDDAQKRYRLPAGYNNAPRWRKFRQRAQTVEEIREEFAPPREDLQ